MTDSGATDTPLFECQMCHDRMTAGMRHQHLTESHDAPLDVVPEYYFEKVDG